MKELPDPIAIQFHLVHDCVRACIYTHRIGRAWNKKIAWWSIGDMCSAEAVVSWNAIFGTNSQKSHWKRIIQMLPIPDESTLKPFSSTLVVEKLEITMEAWSRYHSEMVDARNNWFAHFDHNVPLKPIPELRWALDSCCVYRSWLMALLDEYKLQGAQIQTSEITNEDMKSRFEAEIAEVCA